MSSGNYIRKMFQKQFEPAGAGFLYREAEGEPGVPVSAEERSAAEADLDRRIRRVGVLANGWVLVGFAIGASYLSGRYGASGLVQLAAFICVLTPALLVQSRWQRDAVKRFVGRTPVDRRLSRSESLLRDAAKQSWFMSVVYAAAPITTLLNMPKQHLDGPSRVVFTVIAVLAACYGAAVLSAKVVLALRPIVARTRGTRQI